MTANAARVVPALAQVHAIGADSAPESAAFQEDAFQPDAFQMLHGAIHWITGAPSVAAMHLVRDEVLTADDSAFQLDAFQNDAFQVLRQAIMAVTGAPTVAAVRASEARASIGLEAALSYIHVTPSQVCEYSPATMTTTIDTFRWPVPVWMPDGNAGVLFRAREVASGSAKIYFLPYIDETHVTNPVEVFDFCDSFQTYGVVVWNLHLLAVARKADGTLRYSTSSDNGQTWTAHAALGLTYVDAEVNAAGAKCSTWQLATDVSASRAATTLYIFSVDSAAATTTKYRSTTNTDPTLGWSALTNTGFTVPSYDRNYGGASARNQGNQRGWWFCACWNTGDWLVVAESDDGDWHANHMVAKGTLGGTWTRTMNDGYGGGLSGGQGANGGVFQGSATNEMTWYAMSDNGDDATRWSSTDDGATWGGGVQIVPSGYDSGLGVGAGGGMSISGTFVDEPLIWSWDWSRDALIVHKMTSAQNLLSVIGSGADDLTYPVLAAPSHTTYRAAVVASTPLAYWRLGDVVLTPSGTGYTVSVADEMSAHAGTRTLPDGLGTAQASLTGDDDYSMGFGGSFGGSNAYIAVPAHAAFERTGSIAIEAIIKETAGSGQQGILNKPTVTNGYNQAYELFLDGGTVYFRLNGSFGQSDLTTAAPSLNARHHVVAEWDGTTMRLYIDGTLATSKAQTGTLNTGTAELRIGHLALGFYNWEGLLDEVALYADLSAADVAAHYASWGTENANPPVVTRTVYVRQRFAYTGRHCTSTLFGRKVSVADIIASDQARSIRAVPTIGPAVAVEV